MTLKELVYLHSRRPERSVPEWLLGCFRRYSISFANGLTDLQTQVYWLQSRNFTIDIRLPREAEQLAAKPLTGYTRDELQRLANYEGFSANTDWDGTILSWQKADAALQLHSRWTEPAILKRVGNCMVEFCPSNTYVEDWRLQPSSPGTLVGLRLIEEREISSGLLRHKGGGLIVCGDYAGLVLGRSHEITTPTVETPLTTMAANANGDEVLLNRLFNFETSVAQGSLEQGFSVMLSTQASRLGHDLFTLDGFEAPVSYQDKHLGDVEIIRQKLTIEGKSCERLFLIDTIESHINFDQTTDSTPETQVWFERESAVLARYTEVLR
jgi:hypothetical protein